jgi:PilZ domain
LANSIAAPPTKLQLPVEVIGADLYGQQFFENTRTVTIHRNGVSILLENKLGPDTEVIVRNPETNEEAIAFVVGQTSGDGTAHVYGLAFVDTFANIWRLQFPAAEPARTVQLICSGCHSVCAISLTDIELEIFEASRELTRSCDTCNSFMTWKETGAKVARKRPDRSPAPVSHPMTIEHRSETPAATAMPSANESQGAPASSSSAPPPVASPIEERRKNRRAGMKMTACIRFSGLEFVVTCEDISKGGFRFTGRKEFPKGTRIETAVPYAKSGTNIFTPSTIIYCHKMPDGQFRHGVSYTKSRRSSGWDS